MSNSARADNFLGPFELRQALSFHIVNASGQAFDLNLRYRDEQQSEMDRPLLVRVFDPEERLIIRHDEPGLRCAGPAPWHEIALHVPARGPGVYQVAAHAFAGEIDLATMPDLPWGVYGYPQSVVTGEQFADAYIYLPPRLPALSVRCEGEAQALTISDESGQPRLSLAGPDRAGAVELPTEGERVWRVSTRATKQCALSFVGGPIILCPDEATARAIHASIDVLDDGTITFHKFQVRARELLNRYRAMDAAGFTVAPPLLVRHKARWLEDPLRNRLLLGGYGVYAALDTVLRAQNLDPASPWFGSIDTWRDAAGHPRLDNPWTTYDRLGLSRVARPLSSLAAVYSIDRPFNPLHRDPALRNRIIIAALQELMLLREHELPHPEFTPYYGGELSLTFAEFTFAFPLVVRDCPADVREVWTEGLSRYVDRFTISQVASTVNQWSFIPLGIHQFAAGTGDQWYSEIVERHLRWIIDRTLHGLGQAEAGYFAESEGPDATYQGITNHNLAWLYEETGDEALLAALRRSVILFNHTIAPEPDRLTWQGASSFNCRTAGTWADPQWGGGFGMLADDFPEAAPHLGHAWLAAAPVRDGAALKQAETSLEGSLNYLPRGALRDPQIGMDTIAAGPLIFFPVWKHFAANPLVGGLPMQISDSFTRAFGNEFFCVRRPAYYAFLYTGRPMREWQKDRRPQSPHEQHPRNGGGLCMFWSPMFGTSLLGKNWSSYAAHTIIAEQAPASSPAGSLRDPGMPNAGDAKSADWEDYWSIESNFDIANATAIVRGRLRDQPISFVKRYRFLDDAIECELTLTADADVAFDDVWECFPYPLDKPKPIRVTLLDAEGRVVQSAGGAGGGQNGGRTASAIRFSADAREAHLIIFSEPRACEVGIERSTDLYKQPHENGRVLAALPKEWKAGESRTLRWRMLAVPVAQVSEEVRDALAAMRRGQ